MKIAFLVSSINSKSGGLGGHYHSLLETVTQLAKQHEVLIINIGNEPAKALEENDFKSFQIIHKGFYFLKITKQIKYIIKTEQPDILHAFDVLAYYWARLAGKLLNVKYCLTKCGGINPIYTPYAKNIVLFSKENLSFYESQNKFRDSFRYLIPNRIKQFDDDYERIEKILDNLGDEYKNSFKFLRITRIGKYYRNSSLQLINLVTKLKKDGIKCCAIFVGHIEGQSYFDELKNSSSGNVFFFTNEVFTKNAKALINCSDAVLGTGRSFMEAAAKEKVLLAPSMNADTPALIQNSNFEEAFNYNFSERIQFQGYTDTGNYDTIKKSIQKGKFLNELKLFSRLVFNDYFDSDKLNEKYEKVYAEIKLSKKVHIVDFFLHTLFIIRSYYR